MNHKIRKNRVGFWLLVFGLTLTFISTAGQLLAPRSATTVDGYLYDMGRYANMKVVRVLGYLSVDDKLVLLSATEEIAKAETRKFRGFQILIFFRGKMRIDERCLGEQVVIDGSPGVFSGMPALGDVQVITPVKDSIDTGCLSEAE